VPYTSYLSEKEHSFIEKCNFCDDLKLLKNLFGVQMQGVKNAPFEKILAMTLLKQVTLFERCLNSSFTVLPQIPMPEIFRFAVQMNSNLGIKPCLCFWSTLYTTFPTSSQSVYM
jgi:hypothetical protein